MHALAASVVGALTRLRGRVGADDQAAVDQLEAELAMIAAPTPPIQPPIQPPAGPVYFVAPDADGGVNVWLEDPDRPDYPQPIVARYLFNDAPDLWAKLTGGMEIRP